MQPQNRLKKQPNENIYICFLKILNHNPLSSQNYDLNSPTRINIFLQFLKRLEEFIIILKLSGLTIKIKYIINF